MKIALDAKKQPASVRLFFLEENAFGMAKIRISFQAVDPQTSTYLHGHQLNRDGELLCDIELGAFVSDYDGKLIFSEDAYSTAHHPNANKMLSLARVLKKIDNAIRQHLTSLDGDRSFAGVINALVMYLGVTHISYRGMGERNLQEIPVDCRLYDRFTALIEAFTKNHQPAKLMKASA